LYKTHANTHNESEEERSLITFSVLLERTSEMRRGVQTLLLDCLQALRGVIANSRLSTEYRPTREILEELAVDGR
jgi:hypothetical protein